VGKRFVTMSNTPWVPLIIIAVSLIAIGLMALGCVLAGRWWQGGLRWVMGVFFGLIFILAAVGIFIGGCTILVFTS
jgi:hypothetical protein